jgi:hypothetical protein
VDELIEESRNLQKEILGPPHPSNNDDLSNITFQVTRLQEIEMKIQAQQEHIHALQTYHKDSPTEFDIRDISTVESYRTAMDLKIQQQGLIASLTDYGEEMDKAQRTGRRKSINLRIIWRRPQH